jgi:hypothetical protein
VNLEPMDTDGSVLVLRVALSHGPWQGQQVTYDARPPEGLTALPGILHKALSVGTVRIPTVQRVGKETPRGHGENPGSHSLSNPQPPPAAGTTILHGVNPDGLA